MPSSPLVIGWWAMAIDYSNHRALTETQHWLNRSISSTRSQTSPDGQLWEFTRPYNCSEQTTRLSPEPEGKQCFWDARGCPVSPLYTGGEEMGYKVGPTL